MLSASLCVNLVPVVRDLEDIWEVSIEMIMVIKKEYPKIKCLLVFFFYECLNLCMQKGGLKEWH